MAEPPDDVDTFLAERNAALKAALEVLPLPSRPAASVSSTPADPVLGLYRDWHRACEEMDALSARRVADELADRAFDRIFARSWAAECALVATEAATLAGAVAKLRVFAWQRVIEPWEKDIDVLLVLSALVDLERLAGPLSLSPE